MNRRRGFSMVEVLVGFGIFLVVGGVAYSLLRFGVVSVGATVAPQVGLQMASRKAMVDFIKEIQECIEVARPLPGCTMTYFVARDKLNRIMTAFMVKNDADSTTAGRDIFDLHVYRKDFGGQPLEQKKMLGGIERLTFTSLSPGLLQIHVDLHEAGKTYALLTAVRTRNILAEGRL